MKPLWSKFFSDFVLFCLGAVRKGLNYFDKRKHIEHCHVLCHILLNRLKSPERKYPELHNAVDYIEMNPAIAEQ